MEWGRFLLGSFLDETVELGGGCLIETGFLFESAETDGL